jgi:cytochrome c(L)
VKTESKSSRTDTLSSVGPRTSDFEPSTRFCTPNSELFQGLALSLQSSVLFSAVLLTVLTVVSVYAQNGAPAPQKLNPYTGKAEAIAEGQQLYKKFNCYGCHGMQGGGGMGPNLTDEAWQTGDGSDPNVMAQVRDGKGQMPPYKMMMTDDQAWKVIAFIRTLYKGDPKKAKW